MNANERFEYMAEQFYKKTGMLAPGKDDALLRSEEQKHKAAVAWGIFTERFYSNLFQSHVEMYELLDEMASYDECQRFKKQINELLAKARGEKC